MQTVQVGVKESVFYQRQPFHVGIEHNGAVVAKGRHHVAGMQVGNGAVEVPLHRHLLVDAPQHRRPIGGIA